MGCSIGCDACDGGDAGGANPGMKDRCGSGMNATINNPKHRTINRHALAGSDEDWSRFNPWRAPGTAPVYDSCGRASGGPHATSGHGEFTNTTFATIGDVGSKLPVFDSGVVWKVGSVVEAWWSLRANHGGGYQYRLCPLDSELNEACFMRTPMPFAGNSEIVLGDGRRIEIESTFVSEGTQPLGSQWQMNPIPGWGVVEDGTWSANSRVWFTPPCEDPYAYGPGPQDNRLSQGLCSGEWLHNITIYDKLFVPKHLKPGPYVLGFRWDCESSAQVWQSCADITIVA